jgi:hypothetical protein
VKCKILCVAAIWVVGAHAAFASDPKSTVELNALRDSLLKCWNIPAGVARANLEISALVHLNADGSARGKPQMLPRADLVTSVRFSLNPDGSLRGKPTIAKMGPGEMGKAAADSAVAAVEKCAPYANAAKLGPNNITVNFDPEMH